MKKLMSMLIVFTILISGVVRAQMAADVENTKYEKAYVLLCALDIIDEAVSGTAGIGEKLTRAEFAKMTVRTFGFDVLPEGEEVFSDVDLDTYEGQCINVLYQKGFISYAENFYPENNISFNEAVKIIASAMGAGIVAESYGGYPNGYIRYADEIGILKNITRAEELTKGEAMLLLYNTLNTQVYEDISFIFSQNPQKDTLLKNVFNVESGKGIVSGTDKTKLYSENGAGAGYVEIENEIYITNDTSIYGYLGYEVEFYYTAEPGDEELIAFLPTSKNRVTVINSYNLVSASNNRVVYINHYDRETAEKISENSDFILNGVAKPLQEQSDLMIDNGQLTLIDNNADGVCEVIICESYINYVVSLYSSGKIYSKDTKGEIDIDKLEQDGIIFENKDEFENIREFTVLSVYADCIKEENSVKVCDFENSKNVQIKITNNSVNGYINSMGEEYIVIDGVEYKYSFGVYEMMKNDGVTTGSDCTLYLDVSNRVAYYDRSSAGGILPGILGRIYFEDDSDEDVSAKIFTENAQWVKYPLAQKVTINGDRKYSRDALNVWLKTEGENIPSQLILYKVNENGEITYIDTCDVGNKEDEDNTLTNGFTSYQKFRTGSSTFEGLGGVGKDTKLFVVAGDVNSYTIDPSSEDKFQYYSSALSYLRDNTSYHFKTYCVDDAYVMKYLLVYVESKASATVESGTNISVFDSISMGINNDDETVYILNYYDTNGKLVSVTTEPDAVFYKTENSVNENIDPNTLKRGDLIRIDTSGAMVGAIQFVTRTNTDTPQYGTVISGGAQAGYIQQMRTTCGRVYAKNGTQYSIYYGEDIEALKDMENAYTQLEALSASNVGVLIFDREDNIITNGTAEDITDFVSTNNKNTFIYQCQNYGTPVFIMIVR